MLWTLCYAILKELQHQRQSACSLEQAARDGDTDAMARALVLAYGLVPTSWKCTSFVYKWLFDFVSAGTVVVVAVVVYCVLRHATQESWEMFIRFEIFN